MCTNTHTSVWPAHRGSWLSHSSSAEWLNEYECIRMNNFLIFIQAEIKMQRTYIFLWRYLCLRAQQTYQSDKAS